MSLIQKFLRQFNIPNQSEIIDKMGVVFDLIVINLIFTLIYMSLCYDSSHWEFSSRNLGDETFSQKLFNRFYFSMNIYSTIGIGGPLPVSYTCKFLYMFQIVVMLLSISQFFLS